jgi:hypothetical protein
MPVFEFTHTAILGGNMSNQYVDLLNHYDLIRLYPRQLLNTALSEGTFSRWLVTMFVVFGHISPVTGGLIVLNCLDNIHKPALIVDNRRPRLWN